MAMNDEETCALTVGGHSSWKSSRKWSSIANLGPEPAAAEIHEQGFRMESEKVVVD